eukprot:scaffold339570_cov66-Attheya_sp.AAC.1
MDLQVSDNTCFATPGGVEFSSPVSESLTADTTPFCCIDAETSTSFLDPPVVDDAALIRKIAETVTARMPIETDGAVTTNTVSF